MPKLSKVYERASEKTTRVVYAISNQFTIWASPYYEYYAAASSGTTTGVMIYI